MLLPEHGMTAELPLIQEFLRLVQDDEITSKMDEGLLSAAKFRALQIKRHIRRWNALCKLMKLHIGYRGECKSARHRDVFLAMANDAAFLQGLPFHVRLQANHREYMITHARPQQQCCAA
jgi:hypothetical protein